MKRKIAKASAIALGMLALAVAGLAAYLKLALPNVGPAPDLSVEITPERLERGRYLANHVNLCIDCHSTRDWSLFAGPPKEGTHGMGGDLFDENMGLPGKLYAKNITPAGVGDWTDGELFRAITSGVDKHGKALFPLMPYFNYAQMDPEDIYAIIAYLRTLPAAENTVPKRKLNFPLNFLVNTIPQKPGAPVKRPDPRDQIAYGAYLVNAAACRDCHTPIQEGKPIPGMDLAGGMELKFPDGGIVRPANLTPHETGLKDYTREWFIQRFKMHAADSNFQPPPVRPGAFQTIMPWGMYAGMTEEDLGAIYEYLRTIPPVDNVVVKWEPAKL
jgi:mono/diheme cytochrome c family protein